MTSSGMIYNLLRWIGLLSLLLCASCVSHAPPAPEPKIGGLFGLTGYVSPVGEESRNGFVLAIEDSGMNISYEIRDYASDTGTLASEANGLIDNGSMVIIGPEWNEFGEIVAPIADERHVVFISPWMTGEDAWAHNEYYFSATGSDRNAIRATLQYLAEENLSRIVVIYDDNTFTNGYVELLRQEVKLRPGMGIIGEFRILPGGTDNYSREITRIQAVKPDTIYAVIATDEDQGMLSQQLRAANITTQVFIPLSRGGSPAFLSKYGTVAHGTIFPAFKPYKNIGAFQQKYTQRFGKKPLTVSAASTYDATTLALNLMRKGASTSDDVRNALLVMDRYEGYANQYAYNPNHHLASEEIVLTQIDASNKTHAIA